MDVTVALCTWNRADLLDSTLASLAEVEIPEGVQWKVIVANNNSSDGTERVLDRHVDRLPLQRLFVAQQGKSHAMNAIVRQLEGELVLWTDDDVLFDKQWIAAYVSAAKRWPTAGFFGGRIVPRFLGPEPAWLRPAWKLVAGIYGSRDLGAEPFPFDERRLPFGANMAMRIPLQKEYAYDPDLGRRGELMLAGEETDLMLRLLADGHTGMWTPQSSLEHLVTPERVQIDAIRRYCFGLAESERRPEASASVRRLRGAWLACRALVRQGIGAFYSPTSQPERWLKHVMRVSYSWGQVEACWGDLPTWLKPSPLRQMLTRKRQPRYTESLAPMLTATMNQGLS